MHEFLVCGRFQRLSSLDNKRAIRGILLLLGSGQNYHTGSGPTFKGGSQGKTPWVSDGGWGGQKRHNGSLMVGGGLGKDTIGL